MERHFPQNACGAVSYTHLDVYKRQIYVLPEILWNVTELKEGKRIYEKAFIGYHNKYRNHDWNYLTDFDSGNWKDEYP